MLKPVALRSASSPSGASSPNLAAGTAGAAGFDEPELLLRGLASPEQAVMLQLAAESKRGDVARLRAEAERERAVAELRAREEASSALMERMAVEQAAALEAERAERAQVEAAAAAARAEAEAAEREK
eukprot:2624472-Prymnesium_polylepis.1